ncbi:MAG: hypothetical protein WBC91_20460 [Phototrophicaceae bacterium]
MWIVAEYEATSLFSLKPANATSSGGRTLLVPTPYAIKMALLDVACRVDGVVMADALMDLLSTVEVAIRPPERVVVNNTFIKVLRPRRNPAKAGSADAGYFGRTIAYREYAQLDAPFAIALQVETDEQAHQLRDYLLMINYLGKRGGFIQIQDVPYHVEILRDDFIRINGEIGQFGLDSIMTQLDDTGAGATFEKVSVYSGKRITLGKERILQHVVLPYRLVSSSRGYSYYELNQ